MCGIGGVVQLDKRKKLDSDIQLGALTLLFELQDRGTDAWGVYIEKDGKHNNELFCGEPSEEETGELFKTPKSVTEFFNGDSKIYLDKSNTILMHTRASTQGDSDININNHPFSTKDFVLAHNGTITNASVLKTRHNIDSKGIECDSYVIVALVQKYYDEGSTVIEAIQKMAKEVYGGMACWLYYKPKRQLYLYRKTNPISYMIDNEKNILMFASEESSIRNSYTGIKELSNDIVKDVPSEKICRLNGGVLEVVGDLDTTVYNNGYNDNDWNNRRQLDGDYCDLFPINNSLINLFKIFETQDDGEGVDTVIVAHKDIVCVMVNVEELQLLLDSCGFEEYKLKNKSSNSEYWQYTITPKIKLNELVNNLMNHLTCDMSEDIGDNDDDEIFNGGLHDIAETMGCKLLLTSKQIRFIHSGKPEEYWNKLWKSVGHEFSKDGTLTFSNSKGDKKKISIILDKYGFIGDKL